MQKKAMRFLAKKDEEYLSLNKRRDYEVSLDVDGRVPHLQSYTVFSCRTLEVVYLLIV